MVISKDILKKILVDPGYIKEADFEEVTAGIIKSESFLNDVIHFLVAKKLIPEEQLGSIIATALGYPFVDLKKTDISSEILNIIPEEAARSKRVISFDVTGNIVKIATLDPNNPDLLKYLQEKIRRRTESSYTTSLNIEEKKIEYQIEFYYTTPANIQHALNFYRKSLYEQIKNLIQDLQKNPKNEENIVLLINLFLEYAYNERASDIHIEPSKNHVSVRFRIDGILYEMIDYPNELHDKIVSRLKIMSRLPIDEHETALDGRFDFSVNKNFFDVRVSIMPIIGGENIVMRLLVEKSEKETLEKLGFLDADLEKIKRASSKSYGMILAVGPTGSGKTTILYSILKKLNRPEVNIMTIEDPIEYEVDHIQQTQINPKKNITFANGLRFIVRQDPNIIMVGEIRDNETASIAVNAAMTGHLLLSTLHANDASTAFPRLTEMNTEPFLLVSAINLVIASRLVRKICQECRIEYSLSEAELNILKKEENLKKIIKDIAQKDDLTKIVFYKGSGCKSCGYTGYYERTGVFEILEISNPIRLLVIEKASADAIQQKALELGMTSITHDGIIKVLNGTTTLEEIIRVTRS